MAVNRYPWRRKEGKARLQRAGSPLPGFAGLRPQVPPKRLFPSHAACGGMQKERKEVVGSRKFPKLPAPNPGRENPAPLVLGPFPNVRYRWETLFPSSSVPAALRKFLKVSSGKRPARPLPTTHFQRKRSEPLRGEEFPNGIKFGMTHKFIQHQYVLENLKVQRW